LIAEIVPRAAPGVAIVYHSPGRLRLRGRILEGESRLAASVRESLSGLGGIERVAHNAASGSLLVEYAPEIVDADAIVGRVLEAGLQLDELPRRPDASRAVVGAACAANAKVADMTRGAADLHGVVSFVLGAGAVGSLVLSRGPRWPRWENLLYWSYAFFRDVHARDLERPLQPTKLERALGRELEHELEQGRGSVR
jgi:hypothetical protein